MAAKKITMEMNTFANGFASTVKTIKNNKVYLFFDVKKKRVDLRLLNLLNTADLINDDTDYNVIKVFKDKTLIETGINLSEEMINILYEGLEYSLAEHADYLIKAKKELENKD